MHQMSAFLIKRLRSSCRLPAKLLLGSFDHFPRYLGDARFKSDAPSGRGINAQVQVSPALETCNPTTQSRCCRVRISEGQIPSLHRIGAHTFGSLCQGTVACRHTLGSATRCRLPDRKAADGCTVTVIGIAPRYYSRPDIKGRPAQC